MRYRFLLLSTIMLIIGGHVAFSQNRERAVRAESNPTLTDAEQSAEANKAFARAR